MSEAIRFVNGDPSEEEVAVVLALITSGVAAPAAHAHPEPEPAQGISAWGRPRHMRSRPRAWAESRLP